MQNLETIHTQIAEIQARRRQFLLCNPEIAELEKQHKTAFKLEQQEKESQERVKVAEKEQSKIEISAYIEQTNKVGEMRFLELQNQSSEALKKCFEWIENVDYDAKKYEYIFSKNAVRKFKISGECGYTKAERC